MSEQLKADNEFLQRFVESERQSAQEIIDKLTTALAEIAEGKGRFALDRLEHASNTIEDMKAIAVAALKDIRPDD
jgi:replication-associated recombination protein RarA